MFFTSNDYLIRTIKTYVKTCYEKHLLIAVSVRGRKVTLKLWILCIKWCKFFLLLFICVKFSNNRHATSKIWTCPEPEFRFCWMKLCSSDNHYTNSHLALSKLQQQVWGYGLLLTTNSPEVPGSQFIDLGWMFGRVDLGFTQWFWTQNLWIGNPAP